MTDPYRQQPQAPQQPVSYAPAAPVYVAPVAAPMNALAVVSLVSGIVAWTLLPGVGALVGVITGHLALSQIRRTRESGRGMALAGVILSWIQLGAIILLGVLLVIIGFAAFGAAAGSAGLSS